ncbi:hypothetical protein ACOME3_008554 [Neoechinorhynchus agilis]
MNLLLHFEPCFQIETLPAFDDEIRRIMTGILDVDLSDPGWRQGSLSVHLGCFGVLRATGIAIPAFDSSVSRISRLIVLVFQHSYPNDQELITNFTESNLSNRVKNWN